MSDELQEVRELKLTKLDPSGAQATLTLTDEKLVVETADDSPIPEWLRGEMAFADIDIVYVDPEAELAEDEEPEEKPLPPGLRVTCWIEMPIDEEGTETRSRKATVMVDNGHVDVEQAEAFAATFRTLAGRDEPEVEPELEVEAEAPVTGAPEPVEETAPEPEPEPTDAAFAAPADSAFAAPAEDEKEEEPPSDSAFAAPE